MQKKKEDNPYRDYHDIRKVRNLPELARISVKGLMTLILALSLCMSAMSQEPLQQIQTKQPPEQDAAPKSGQNYPPGFH
ncbi:MAG: hypothetical protein KJ607_01930 [Bacteroidetes bacterium]|nr:hypothetical protein [Bacteroidota bacterium]